MSNAVACARQFHVADHRTRHGTQPLDEVARLLDRDDVSPVPWMTRNGGASAWTRAIGDALRNTSGCFASCASPRPARGSRRSAPAPPSTGPPSRSGHRYRPRRPRRYPSRPAIRSASPGRSASDRPAPTGAHLLNNPQSQRNCGRPRTVDVGARPRDRSLDVSDVRRPAMMWRHPIVDRQTHPTHLRQVRHQRVALQQAAAVHPCAARHEDQHRRRFNGNSLGRQTSSSCEGRSP